MSNFNSSVNSYEQTTELYLKKVLAGNIKTVRVQLIDAMESLGYDIIEDDPHIVGRRGAKGWAVWFGSADVLEYGATLVIRLKPISENSTRVTFDYLIKHGMLTKGDKAIIVKEAETLAAISKTHAIEKLCSVCETESTDDSRFCRQCGTPLTSEQAELEVLRLMAETRAGKSSVVGASFFMIFSIVLLTVVTILNSAELLKPKAFVVLFAVGTVMSLLAIISSLFGWNRLKRALEKPENEVRHFPRQVSESLETGEFYELPPRQTPASVTEGTTNLLDQEWTNRTEKEKVPVRSQRNTNELN